MIPLEANQYFFACMFYKHSMCIAALAQIKFTVWRCFAFFLTSSYFFWSCSLLTFCLFINITAWHCPPFNVCLFFHANASDFIPLLGFLLTLLLHKRYISTLNYTLCTYFHAKRKTNRGSKIERVHPRRSMNVLSQKIMIFLVLKVEKLIQWLLQSEVQRVTSQNRYKGFTHWGPWLSKGTLKRHQANRF